MNVAKIWSLVLLFKDVTEEYKKVGIDGRPWYAQRTFVGACVALVMGTATVLFGIVLDPTGVMNIADNIPVLITAGASLYGTVLAIYGAIQKLIKSNKN